jgi:hypothetical protein
MPFRFNPFTGNLDEVDTTAAAGSDTQIQYNDNGSLAASPDLAWDDSGKVLDVGGDINLDDGGTYKTTLQIVTPATADRTITFPDATGTLALVAGSSGQAIYNDAGAYSGLSTVTTDGTDVTLTGRFISSLNGAASAPPATLTGTWFTGGTATTTKPQLLLEPAGTTSTAWSTAGTGLGINATSGFTGRLLDAQVNGTSRMVLTGSGNVGINVADPTLPLDISGSQIKLARTGGIDLRINNFFGNADVASITVVTNHPFAFHTNNVERFRVAAAGNVGIATTDPTTRLDVNSNAVRLRTARTPASATATGAQGEISWDADYIYVCTATDTWKRAALSTW